MQFPNSPVLALAESPARSNSIEISAKVGVFQDVAAAARHCPVIRYCYCEVVVGAAGLTFSSFFR
jgi:hypothetical protein